MAAELIVRDMTVDQLKGLVRETIEEVFQEWLGDPDEGLELRPEIAGRLRRALDNPDQRGRPVQEVAQRLGLEW